MTINGIPEDEQAVYVISVAAELSGLHPQTLRQYDRMGLVSPGRATGRGRRYSLRDIASLRNIQRLVGDGINLAGIKRIMDLESAVAHMALEMAKLRIEVDSLMSATPGAVKAAWNSTRELPAPPESSQAPEN
jgi:MerR family transcriptional regulator/heat shock protein HspR